MDVKGYLGDSLKGAIGITEKAVLEICDFSGLMPKESRAPKASNGAGSGFGGIGNFNVDTLKDAINGATKNLKKVEGQNEQQVQQGEFIDVEKVKWYRYHVQFNPEDISINGYGGEEMPIQDFGKKREDGAAPPKPPIGPDGIPIPPKLGKHGRVKPSSRMAAASTRIDMSLKLVLDKADIKEAFFAEKYSMGQTALIKQGAKMLFKKDPDAYSVQKDVEALSAIVRDKSKRLCRFVWGDMIYEGLIHSVNAEYTMFNVDGTPCRAVVNLGMVLLDKEELPSSEKHWRKVYTTTFGKTRNNPLG